MKGILKEAKTLYCALEIVRGRLADMFHTNTGLYKGDPLFEPKNSPICKYWTGEEAEGFGLFMNIFMNNECTHPECDDEDSIAEGRGYCAIAFCPDGEKEKPTQPAGQIVKMHDECGRLANAVVKIFNDNSEACPHRGAGHFCRNGAEFNHCCIIGCPL